MTKKPPPKPLPCPWPGCKRKPRNERDWCDIAYVFCLGKDHFVRGGKRKTRRGAINAWNNRKGE